MEEREKAGEVQKEKAEEVREEKAYGKRMAGDGVACSRRLYDYRYDHS